MWCFSVIIVLVHTSIIFAQYFPRLLLVSFDGFRHDYLKIHGPLKNFQRLEERGVHARNMISTFTTATFPNHYSLVTGLYEEVHGIVSNQMYDPAWNLTFEQPDKLTNADWWPYPAIWSINEQRKGGRSGVASWPQESLRISRFEPYKRSRPFRDIIDKILLWFNEPIEPINFGAIYFDEPDLTGHQTGPYSVNMSKIVRQCDEHLGYLLDQIDANKNLRENLHLIVVSDHGMEQINGTKNPLYIENYIDETRVKVFGIPPAMNIFVQSPDDIEIVMQNLSKIPHSNVYRRQDIPDRYHYKNHPRIGDLFLLFEPGYEIVRKPTPGGKVHDYTLIHGNHGYDNQLDSMKGIFYASGPQFKQNFTLDNSSVLYNIDLFSLMCTILEIEKCPPSNGSYENIQPFLKPKSKLTKRAIVFIGFIGLVGLIGLAWLVIFFRNNRKNKAGLEEQCNTHLLSQINKPKLAAADTQQP